MEQQQETEQNQKSKITPKQVLIAGIFYVFLFTTIGAFLFHLFGLDWFESTVEIEDPSKTIQEVVKGMLKAFELVFVYKMLSRKSFLFCIVLSVLQTVLVGFVPMGTWQSVADAVTLVVISVLFRKDKIWAIVDCVFLYTVMTLYSLMLTVAKFDGISVDYGYSFYASVVSILDFKLFIVTLYLYTRYKGGIKLWMKKKRLLSP